ncbi:class I SAM-dependent methyltransferase [Nocardia lijiangensis]|uniref:class I SAM-dependent methyltransferase n=1 Tax=Nocardia lijiangensis TaxID=299618 RepID=UPI003D75FB49
MTTPVELTGVPETMLWTLHGRAGAALSEVSLLNDPECLRVYHSIEYDYEGHFGAPDRGLAVRAKAFDDVVEPWLAEHPGGTVVELAAGLETQFHRCDDGLVRWLCVDVAEAIEVRKRFLPPTDRHRCVPRSALDLSWFDEVDARRGVFVSAQGLFMYFEPSRVRQLCVAILNRFPGVVLMFDTVARWFSRKTMEGYALTPRYTTPRMAWGIDTSEISEVVRGWSPRIADVSVVAYGPSRGIVSPELLEELPMLRGMMPSIVVVRSSGAAAT